jgi:sulfur relay (sulfurtransferase) DsrF/TusC family protein
MTKQKIINAISIIRSNYPPHGYSEFREALDLAIEALKRQTPIRPISSDGIFSLCPSCRQAFIDSKLNYCGKCGQRLSWE